MKMPTPMKSEHFHTPCSTRVMFMGESDSTETQPSKPVCDWMIGFQGKARQVEKLGLKNCP
jgi:hypothetical protein